MLWATCCTYFHGFLRSGEATVPTLTAYDPSVHLSMADVSLDSASNQGMAILRIKASKTDEFRHGVNVFLRRTDNDLCPVAALLAYIARRGTDPGPLFRFSDGSRLTRGALGAKYLCDRRKVCNFLVARVLSTYTTGQRGQPT